MKSTKVLVVIALTVIFAVFATSAFAKPLSNTSQLALDAGSGSAANTPCATGSCFGMYQGPGLVLWTDFAPGLDGGIILGKDQQPGSLVGGTEMGDLSDAWNFFQNWGTFATAAFSGGSAGAVTTTSSANTYDNMSCTDAASCAGKTTLGTWHVSWNGVAVPMGSALGCLTTTPANCIGVTSLIWDGGAGPAATGSTFELNYAWAVPDGDPSGFGNVPFYLVLRGSATNIVDLCADAATRCSDNNSCTTDFCDPVTGMCVHSPVANGTTCTSANKCLVAPLTCNNGTCTGTAKVCNDNNPCTTDTCTTSIGACKFTALNGGTCNDNNACTLNDTCVSGVCKGTVKNCSDNDPCTTDSCDTATGLCSNACLGNITPCPCPSVRCTSILSPGMALLPSGTKLKITQGVGSGINTPCSVGSCFSMETAPGTLTWTNFGPGTDGGIVVGKSQASGGQETGPSFANSTPGELSNAWFFFNAYGTFYTVPGGDTQNYFCNTGCSGADCIKKTELKVFNVAWNGNIIPMGSAAGCTHANCSSDQLQGIFEQSYTINPVEGGAWSLLHTEVVPSGQFTGVRFQAQMRGTVHLSDLCANVTCGACTSCNASNGLCESVSNGTTCDDGNACTTNDVCTNGVCGGAQIVCTASDQCHVVGTCTAGACSNPTAPDGTACNDNNACTVSDVCSSGVCAGQPKPVDDLNPCTIDACDPVTGNITHTPAPAVVGYTITDLGTLGGTDSSADKINNNGQVVGYAFTAGNAPHAFLYSNGAMTDLGTLGGTESFAGDINNSGQVAGYAKTAGNIYHAFLYNNGAMTDLGTLGGTDSLAYGINNSGQVVGNADTAGNIRHAFLYNNGAMTDLGTLGGTDSYASGINDSGQVVGVASTGDYFTEHAFLYSDGAMTDLGTLGGTFSSAKSINNNGQVVGLSVTADNAFHAFFYSNGAMTDLGTLFGGSVSEPMGINNNGQVVGNADTAGNVRHAFLYSGGSLLDLNDLLPSGSGWELTIAYGINDLGQIVGAGMINGHYHAFLMTLVTKGIACDDGNKCTTNDVCTNGVCIGTPVVCTALDQCHVAGICTAGVCSNPIKPNGTPCNDNNACTTYDMCTSGLCVGTLIVLTASDQCHVAGTCDPVTGVVSNPTAPNGTSCNDGNACTTNDVCTNGYCGGTPKNCNDNNPCTTDSCNAGVCAHTYIPGCDPQCAGQPDRTPCSLNYIVYDPSVCHNDYCSSGVCVKGNEQHCDDNNVCTTDTCVEAYGSGFCVFTDNTAACSDGNACTVNDVCSAGVCVPGLLKSCDDGNCCTTDSCDSATGACVNSATPGCGTAGTPLTHTTLGIEMGAGSGPMTPCSTGSCFGMEVQPGYVLWTDFGAGTDGGFVTGKAQSCGELSATWNFFGSDGCFNTTPGGETNMFNTTSCSGLDCVNKTALNVFNVVWGGGTIPMGSACGVNDYQVNADNTWSMSYSSVVPSGPMQGVHFSMIVRGTRGVCGCCESATRCNDNNVCTVDSCDPATGNCVHTPAVCNPIDACHTASCNPAIGCVQTPIDCDDNNVCTTDGCNQTLGCYHIPIVCNDGDPCTIDSCDKALGCVYTPIVCNDGDACTIDKCVNGVCVYTPIVCNDNNACTTEACVNGVCITTSTKNCDDGNACTNDSCDPATGSCINTRKCAAGETCDPAVGTCYPICPAGSVKNVVVRGGGQKPSGADLQIQTSFTVMNAGCIVGSSASSLTCTAGTVLQVNVNAGFGPPPTSVILQGNPIATDINFMITCTAGEVYKLDLDNKNAPGGKDVDRITINVQ